MIAAVAHSRRFRDRPGRKFRIPALRRRESLLFLAWIGLGFIAAETLSELLAYSRSVELNPFGPIVLALLIFLAGYRSVPPDRPCFMPGGCTVASAARHRAFFHRCLSLEYVSGWGSGGSGRAVLATSPPGGPHRAASAGLIPDDGSGCMAMGRGQTVLGPEVLDCSAACDVPVAYRFVRAVKSRGSLLAFTPPFAASRERSSQKNSPSPIA